MTRWLHLVPVLAALLFLWPSVLAHAPGPSGARTELYIGSGYVWVYANGTTVPVYPSHSPAIQEQPVAPRGVASGSVPFSAPAMSQMLVVLLALSCACLLLVRRSVMASGPGLARGPPVLALG